MLNRYSHHPCLPLLSPAVVPHSCLSSIPLGSLTHQRINASTHQPSTLTPATHKHTHPTPTFHPTPPPCCCHPSQVSDALGLPDIKNRQWSIQETSALRGAGLFEGFDWCVAVAVAVAAAAVDVAVVAITLRFLSLPLMPLLLPLPLSLV
jgi:hypothetical protein